MTKKQLVSKRYASWVLYAKFQIEKNIVWWNILLWTCWRKHVFPKRSVRVSDTLDLRSHVIAISTATVAKKLLVGRWQKKQLVSKRYASWVLYAKFQMEKNIVWWNILLYWKTLAINIKFCAMSNSLFFYELLIDPQPTFLECIVIFL